MRRRRPKNWLPELSPSHLATAERDISAGAFFVFIFFSRLPHPWVRVCLFICFRRDVSSGNAIGIDLCVSPIAAGMWRHGLDIVQPLV